MPKYYFHVRQANGSVSNETFDAEFDNDEAAREEAGQALAEMARDTVPLRGIAEFEVCVRDQSGHEIARRWARFVADDYASA
ncbi:DUF6894 family protein [Devosia sp. CAU 1758]